MTPPPIRVCLEFVYEGTCVESVRRCGALTIDGDHVLIVVENTIVDSDPGGIRMLGCFIRPNDAFDSIEIRVLVKSFGSDSCPRPIRIVEIIEKHLDVLIIHHLGIRCRSVDEYTDLISGVVQDLSDGVDIRRPLVQCVLHPV